MPKPWIEFNHRILSLLDNYLIHQKELKGWGYYCNAEVCITDKNSQLSELWRPVREMVTREVGIFENSQLVTCWANVKDLSFVGRDPSNFWLTQ